MDKYYKISKTSETGKKIQVLLDKDTRIMQLMGVLKEKYGVTGFSREDVNQKNISYVSLSPKSDLNLWKRKLKGYIPREHGSLKNLVELEDLRKIWDEIMELGFSRLDTLNLVGATSSDACGCFRGRTENFLFFYTWTPWFYQMPEDCEEITADEYLNLMDPKRKFH